MIQVKKLFRIRGLSGGKYVCTVSVSVPHFKCISVTLEHLIKLCYPSNCIRLSVYGQFWSPGISLDPTEMYGCVCSFVYMWLIMIVIKVQPVPLQVWHVYSVQIYLIILGNLENTRTSTELHRSNSLYQWYRLLIVSIHFITSKLMLSHHATHGTILLNTNIAKSLPSTKN